MTHIKLQLTLTTLVGNSMSLELSLASKIFATLLASTFTLAQAAEPVRIGFIDLLSGPFALTGQSSLKQLREVVN